MLLDNAFLLISDHHRSINTNEFRIKPHGSDHAVYSARILVAAMSVIISLLEEQADRFLLRSSSLDEKLYGGNSPQEKRIFMLEVPLA